MLLSLPIATSAQSFVGGALSSLPGPYGIPASTVADAFQVPNSYLTVPIHGYNTSIPAGSTVATGSTIDGWTLAIGVSANVPLAGATNATVNTQGYMEMTALSITPPAALDTPSFRTRDWRLCAIVFTGGLLGVNGTAGTARDGGCGEDLPGACIAQLQAMSVAPRGNGSESACGGMEVPELCVEHFVGHGDGYVLEISPSEDGDAGIFFAAGSAPFTHRGNATLLAKAENAVWPLVLTWTHFGEGNQTHDSVGWMSCLQAGGAGASSAGSRVLGTSTWALALAGAVAMAI
ncbi:hypothetical protein QBC34DRAFT_305980 [Podospora aff. communis PSN243]|uniref:Uncharacterized protein n=1 Tax=Podospora aff. communis PSN243 TaxID=3040156 RepID=A0AAV9GEV8_9PEZI|nr:hypothetical protein QBC34DRAFT_305980 [Podospora aff. communis PSN243]